MKLSQRVLIAVLNWLTAKLNAVMSVGLNADESNIGYRQTSGMIISDEPGTYKMRHGGQRKMRFKGIGSPTVTETGGIDSECGQENALFESIRRRLGT